MIFSGTLDGLCLPVLGCSVDPDINIRLSRGVESMYNCAIWMPEHVTMDRKSHKTVRLEFLDHL